MVVDEILGHGLLAGADTYGLVSGCDLENNLDTRLIYQALGDNNSGELSY